METKVFSKQESAEWFFIIENETFGASKVKAHFKCFRFIWQELASLRGTLGTSHLQPVLGHKEAVTDYEWQAVAPSPGEADRNWKT